MCGKGWMRRHKDTKDEWKDNRILLLLPDCSTNKSSLAGTSKGERDRDRERPQLPINPIPLLVQPEKENNLTDILFAVCRQQSRASLFQDRSGPGSGTSHSNQLLCYEIIRLMSTNRHGIWMDLPGAGGYAILKKLIGGLKWICYIVGWIVTTRNTFGRLDWLPEKPSATTSAQPTNRMNDRTMESHTPLSSLHSL